MKKMKILAIGCTALLALSGVACNDTAISAYDLAVKNGFKGTEQEWLLSLKGSNGADGRNMVAQDLYQEAVEKGFEGDFLAFCQFLGVTIPEKNNTVQIAENMMSVVSIYCSYTKTKGGSGWLGHGSTKEYGSQAGSGVIVELDKEAGNAVILTNYHVLYNLESDQKGILEDIWVYPYGAYNGFTPEKGDQDGDGIQATYVGGAMDYDLAVLRIENNDYIKNSEVTAAKLGDSNAMSVGEETYVIGNPAGAGIAVTNGILSVDSEYISMGALDNRDVNPQDGYVDTVSYRVMRTSAAINSGNSGGGMFNAAGELVGIVNAKSSSSTVDNMGYALPMSQVKEVYKNVCDNGGKVRQAMLGITVALKSSKAVLGEDGRTKIQEEFSVYQEANNKGSSYKKLSSGDIFLSARVNDNEEVVFSRRYQLTELLLSVRLGDAVTFRVRNSNGVTETVVIEFDDEKYFTTYA